MPPIILILLLILVSGASAFIGGFYGFLLRDRAITNDVEGLGMLSGWIVHNLSQDAGTGMWDAVAFSLTDKDESGNLLVVNCVEQDNLKEALKKLKYNIDNKIYFSRPKD